MFNRGAQPATAQVILMDEHQCSVSVLIELKGKHIEEFSLQEIDGLARAAAQHLVSKS